MKFSLREGMYPRHPYMICKNAEQALSTARDWTYEDIQCLNSASDHPVQFNCMKKLLNIYEGKHRLNRRRLGTIQHHGA